MQRQFAWRQLPGASMNLQQSPTSTVERPGARNGSETRLHGRWLVLARVGWIAVTMTLVILNLIALPDTYGAHFTFTPQVLQDLHRLGLSPTLYSILLTVENAPFQLVYLALGLLLFLRRSDDRMALFCAFALVTFGNALPFYDFTNGSIVPTLATNAILRVVALVLFAMGEASLVLFFYLFPSGRSAGSGLLAGSDLLSDAALECGGTGDLPGSLLLVDRCGSAGLSLPARLHAQGTPADQRGGLWLSPGNADAHAW